MTDTSLAQSNVSDHLGGLRDCGLIIAERDGRYVTYRLSDSRAGDILTLSESLLADVARSAYECTRHDIPRNKHAEVELAWNKSNSE